MKPVVTRLVVFGAAVGSLALLAGAVMLVLRLAQPTEYPVDRLRAPDGEMVGRVAKIEPGVILLSSEPSGSGVVPLVVTKDTRVMLGAIEGWINDVRPGGQIKVAYDLYEGKRLARSVEVLPEQGARRPAPAEPPAKAASTVKPAETPSPAPLPKPEPPAPRPKAEPPRVAQPKLPTPAPATPPRVAPVPPTPVPPAPAAPPPAPPRPAVVTPAPPPPAAPAPVAPASVPPRPAPQESESTDGSAAVDWFLKGRR